MLTMEAWSVYAQIANHSFVTRRSPPKNQSQGFQGGIKTKAIYWESVFVGQWGWFYILHVRVDPVNKVGGLGVHSGVAGLSAPIKARIVYVLKRKIKRGKWS